MKQLASPAELRPLGQVLTSGAGARPVQGFCASLGHRRDDETGLVTMRARYYDPQAGRFISEDPAMQGANWFAYCSNDPVNRADESGRSSELLDILRSVYAAPLLQAGITAYQIVFMIYNSKGNKSAAIIAIAGLTMLAAWMGGATQDRSLGSEMAKAFAGIASVVGIVGLDNLGRPGGSDKVAGAVANYASVIAMFIRLMNWEESQSN